MPGVRRLLAARRGVRADGLSQAAGAIVPLRCAPADCRGLTVAAAERRCALQTRAPLSRWQHACAAHAAHADRTATYRHRVVPLPAAEIRSECRRGPSENAVPPPAAAEEAVTPQSAAGPKAVRPARAKDDPRPAVVFGRRTLPSDPLGLDGIGQRHEHRASAPGWSGSPLAFPTHCAERVASFLLGKAGQQGYAAEAATRP